MWDLTLMVLAVIVAVLAVGIKDLIKSIIAFLVMCVFIAILYYGMGAPYASLFQFLIYAGAVSVLLIVTVHTIRRRRMT